MGEEAKLQSQVIAMLELSGLTWWRVPLGGIKHGGVRKRNPMTGFPDLCGLTPTGILWGLELKAGKEKPSEAQLTMHQRLRSSGAIIAVARSVEEVQGFLALIKNSQVLAS